MIESHKFIDSKKNWIYDFIKFLFILLLTIYLFILYIYDKNNKIKFFILYNSFTYTILFIDSIFFKKKSFIILKFFQIK